MTIETIQSADGRMYNIEYDGYLHPEQRSQIMRRMGCSTCMQNYGQLSYISTLQTNLLLNPGFEIPNPTNPNRPNNWGTYTTGTTQIYTYPEPGRIGGSSVAIEYAVAESGKFALWVQNARIDPTKQYKLSGWIKTSNIVGTGAMIYADWKTSTNVYIVSSYIMKIRQIGTTDWTYFEGTITPALNSVSVSIIGSLYNSSGKVWFDDISFSEVSAPGVCTATTKTVGQIVTLRSAPTGQGPFTSMFKKDGTQIGTNQTIPTGGFVTYDYITLDTDISTIPHIFSVETMGSCAGSVPCTEYCSVTVQAVQVPVLTTITIPATSVIVYSTTTMIAECKDQTGVTMTCPTLTWSSSNTAVATVNTTGIVTGVAIGTATITATAGTVSGSAIVTVGAQVLGSITLAPVGPAVSVGSTVSLTATCKDTSLIAMTCPALTWTSSNGLVATVGTTGVVTGVAIGTATITATSGTITDSTTVTVSCIPTVCGFSVT